MSAGAVRGGAWCAADDACPAAPAGAQSSAMRAPTLRHLLLAVVCSASSVAASATAAPLVLESPSGVSVVTVDVVSGRLVYSVSFGGREVIRPSALGLGLEGAPRLDAGFAVVGQARDSVRTAWKPTYGERSEYPDRYNALRVELRETLPPGRVLVVSFRAYDEGVALRYEVPRQPGLAAFVIGDEATEFRLPAGTYGWETAHAQAVHRRVAIAEMRAPSERPFLVEIPGGTWAAIADAAVEASSSMWVAKSARDADTVVSRLMGPVSAQSPYQSPWRVIFLGNAPGDLLEHNYLLQNLSPSLRLKATDWIRPGKVLREVTLSTRGGREAVDFAAAHGLQYIEYDAGWYGYEYDDGSDATRVSVDPRRLRPEPEYQGLDLPAVIQYARTKGIGVWLYVNRRALERQIDVLLPLFRSWGVVGVKYGFVNVNTQPWTEWLWSAVRKAADHHLMVDIHDEFRPTGMARTFPHLLTQEGIRGNEEFPDAAQGTVLPFTRMLAGAGDHTFCWLDQRLKNTWGYQLAHALVIYSPLQFLYWYDRASALAADSASPGIEWFARLPTVWDETRVLGGRPGEFVAMARRKGDRWFVGVITNDDRRDVRIPLDFLGQGARYDADLYVDGDGARDVRKQQRAVSGGDVLEFALQARGGAAIALTPARH
jgi:alpha-glucosidase